MARARCTAIGGLDPKTLEWLQCASDEHLRRHGRFRALVLRKLAPSDETTDEGNGFVTRVVRTKGRQPSREDLIAAYDESPDPLPPPIVDYIVRHYVKGMPLKTGSKTPKTTEETVWIIAFYRHQLRKAESRAAAGLTSTPATRAKKRTAAKFGISVSTLEHLLTAESRRLAALTSPSK